MSKDFIKKLQDILNQYKEMAESGADIKAGVDINQELKKSIDDLFLRNTKGKTEKAFRLALLREMTEIDAQMNLNSLKQDLEEIKIEEEMKNIKDDLSKLEGGLDIVNEEYAQ